MAPPNPGTALRYPTAAIQAFWAWWDQARPHVETAIDTGEWGDLVEAILSHVHAIDPGLAWNFSPGQRARHALCVSPEGTPALRPLTERWRRAGPPADATWEYHPARPATPEMLHATLELGGRMLHPAASRVRLSVDDLRQVVDVDFFHPAFRKLPEYTRLQLAFIVLDGLLGEDGVAGWIGEIQLHAKEPPGTVAAEALPDIVRNLAQRHAEPTWALFETTDAGRPVHVAARRPLKRVDWPLLDLHGRITITIEPADPRSHREAHDLEDELLAGLGDHALLAAHETRDAQRILYLYCDSQGRHRRWWRSGKQPGRRRPSPCHGQPTPDGRLSAITDDRVMMGRAAAPPDSLDPDSRKPGNVLVWRQDADLMTLKGTALTFSPAARHQVTTVGGDCPRDRDWHRHCRAGSGGRR